MERAQLFFFTRLGGDGLIDFLEDWTGVGCLVLKHCDLRCVPRDNLTSEMPERPTWHLLPTQDDSIFRAKQQPLDPDLQFHPQRNFTDSANPDPKVEVSKYYGLSSALGAQTTALARSIAVPGPTNASDRSFFRGDLLDPG